MRLHSLCAALAACSAACATVIQPRDYSNRDYYALHLDSSTSPSEIASYLGVRHDGQLADLDCHHIFSAPKHSHDIVAQAKTDLRLKRRRRGVSEERHVLDGILYDQKQVRRKRLVKRGVPDIVGRDARPQTPGPPDDEAAKARSEMARELSIKDPIFNDQWHLFNTEQLGHDLNVSGVWSQGITGKNATVCIVDDGLDMDSKDLAPNYFAAGSYDFNDHVDEPKPRLIDDQHGTRCAGEVAAAKNDACGVGVAWDSNIAGIRILSAPINDIDEAEAVMYGYQDNDIYSCSWGPPDDGKTMEAPGILIKKAMVSATQKGRGGKGTIYVFAAGNGAPHEDNCNFDGYTNSIYSVTVGAIDKEDKHPWYSEACSALMVVTYSSGSSGKAITTTDVGENKCTSNHGGTSAAGPLASGLYALILQERPDMSWRDIQWLTVLTSLKPSPSRDPDEEPNDWQTGPLGRPYSHTFGYGKLDAGGMVEFARTWKTVKPQAWYTSPWFHVRTAIPQGDTGLTNTFKVTEEMLQKANLERLEHITVTMNVEHARRGDLSVELISPSGMVSHLSVTRKDDDFEGGYNDWTFMSVAHWGETGVGNWTIVVKDTNVNENNGTFTDWKLRLYGECIDPANQALFPMPDEHEDDDHDEDVPHHIATTSIAIPSATSIAGNPSDRPFRPSHPGRPSATTGAAEAPPSALPEAEHDDEVIEPTPSPSASASPSHDNFLPSPFPTFGVSKKTQIWIYAALGLILAFVVSLGCYLFLARRKRLRLQGRLDKDYEFTTLPVDEDGAGGGGGRRGKGGRQQPRRAGELYDAFAGESDEDLFSDEDEAVDDQERSERDRMIREAGGGGYRDERGDGGEEGRHLSEKRQ